MMISAFGEQGDPRHERERLGEIGEFETARDRIARLVMIPVGQSVERLGTLRFAQLLDHDDAPEFLAYVAAMAGAGQPERYAPSAAEIETLARAALDRLPAGFRVHLSGVLLIVEDFADDAILRDMEIEDAFDLTGLYSGRPIGEPAQTGDMPATIHLYRRPLLDEWAETGVSLEALIAHVLIHEVGHHFGLSDADMHALEASAE